MTTEAREPDPPAGQPAALRTVARAIVLLAGALCACHPTPVHVGPTAEPHGATTTAIGEVTATGAVLWARCARPTTLHVRLDDAADERTAEVGAANDYAATFPLAPLTAATRYTYRAWCGGDVNGAATGAFRTAPLPDTRAAVHFAWGGDVAGQNVCRDRARGFPIFTQLGDRGLDFFIGLGDMIYADDQCQLVGRYGNAQLPGPPPAIDLAGFRAHWQYNWSDPALQRLLRATPYYGVWDDHEIRNDSGPHDDETARAPGVHLLPIALQAFLDYQPLVPPADDPTRLYRRVRWGRHVELFLLDTRQYRDALAAPDRDAHPKTMLGAAQLAWLEQGLAQSDATWKIIVASVPLSIPTGGATARDGFADGGNGQGYEHEAARIFRTLRAHGIRNSLWITTDVHFATGFAYRPFADDPSWTAYEFTSGPLNAGVFPRPDLDPTFRPERLMLYAPPSAEAIASFDEAIGWFNFGQVDIDADGALTVSIVDGRGETVFQSALPPKTEKTATDEHR
jgi:alkaline phosphatase D